jgi:hypothetical protein
VLVGGRSGLHRVHVWMGPAYGADGGLPDPVVIDDEDDLEVLQEELER